ncbi:MAG TPA: hypothetical protein VJN88_14900, partial [Ktedonobacterales bacterium]|nr:hypothetical protein [Ktedonobacterales bacterium]
MASIEAIQEALREAGVDGWLFYDFRKSNPIALRVLGLPEEAFFSRRWAYYVPAHGQPSALVSAVESHVLNRLPGERRVYRTWQQFQRSLGEMVAGAKTVAMEYTPNCANPYVSRVDAGTVELIRSLGPEVVSSGDFAQRFEAVLTPAQIESHRAAGRALLRARDGVAAWTREQTLAGTDLTEYSVQQEFSRLMRAEGLHVEAGDEPLVAVNGNAG